MVSLIAAIHLGLAQRVRRKRLALFVGLIYTVLVQLPSFSFSCCSCLCGRLYWTLGMSRVNSTGLSCPTVRPPLLPPVSSLLTQSPLSLSISFSLLTSQPYKAQSCPPSLVFRNFEFWHVFLLGSVLSIGGVFTSVSIVLLSYYIYTHYKRAQAESEIKKRYKEKQSIERKLEERGEADSYTTLAPLINRLRNEGKSM